MRGLTLMELIVALAVSSILIAVIGTFTVSVVKAHSDVQKRYQNMEMADIPILVFRDFGMEAEEIQLSNFGHAVKFIYEDGSEKFIYLHNDGTTNWFVTTSSTNPDPNLILGNIQSLNFTSVGIEGVEGPHTIKMDIIAQINDEVIERTATIRSRNIDRP